MRLTLRALRVKIIFLECYCFRLPPRKILDPPLQIVKKGTQHVLFMASPCNTAESVLKDIIQSTAQNAISPFISDNLDLMGFEMKILNPESWHISWVISCLFAVDWTLIGHILSIP